MASKIAKILTSVRFWIVSLTAIISVLNGTPVLDTFQIWAAAVAGIGTLDSIATKIGGGTV